MKRLSKAQLKERDALSEKMRNARADLEKAINDAYEAGGTISNAHSVYKEAVEEAASWRENLVSEMDSYASDRSDKWQESDAGQAFEEWKSEWEGAELEVEELEAPDLDEIAPDRAETLDELPEEA